MSSVLDNAKAKWQEGANYDQLGENESTLIGVTAEGNVFVPEGDKNISTLNVKGGVIVTKTPLGPSFKVIDSVSFMHVVNNDSVSGIDAVDVEIFKLQAQADIQPLYAGAGVGFSLAGGKASIFDFNLGVGLTTEIGLKSKGGKSLKNMSFNFKVAGVGVSIGPTISVSVLDSSFGISLVRSADALWFLGDQLIVAVATVPGAFEDAGKGLLEELKNMPGAFADAGIAVGEQLMLIPNAFAPIPAAFADAGSQIGDMIWSGLSGMSADVAAAAMSAIGASADVAAGALKAAGYANDAIDGALGAAGYAADSIGDAMGSMAEGSWDFLKDLIGKINPLD